jgi:hypothetical protein
MTTSTISRGRRVLLAGLALAALTGGGTLATSAAAAAAPAHSAPGGREFTAPPAVPGVPDVGLPGEGAHGRDVPTVDPQGRRVPSRTSEGAFSTLASGSTATLIVANGARIRSYPVTGTVVGLAYYGDWFWVSCKRRATDGYVWGYGTVGSRRGWIRDDLWDVIYFTAPGAPSPRPIPWC